MRRCPLCRNIVPEQFKDDMDMNCTTYWFTGLPCSGKTTLADAISRRLTDVGYNTLRLDGDVVRNGLCYGLGFSSEGRSENLRRVAEVAEMMNDHMTPVFASFITPTELNRSMINNIIFNVKFIYVSTPAAECERRDVKGMWEKARKGLIKGFTGVDSDYQVPQSYDMMIDTSNSLDECINQFLNEYFPHIVELPLIGGNGI